MLQSHMCVQFLSYIDRSRNVTFSARSLPFDVCYTQLMKLLVANWVYLENKKVLLNRAKGKSFYYLPGGKVDKGETPEEAVIREVKEEVAVQLLPGTLRPLQVFQGEAHEKTDVIIEIRAYTSDFRGQLKPSGETAEIRFFSYTDYFSLPEKHIVPLGILVFDYLKNEGLIE